MKVTGIVRRVDDLGRIVIPKDIRKAMRIREGDPLELFTQNEFLCFKKYQAHDEADWAMAAKLVKAVIPDFKLLDGYGDDVNQSHGPFMYPANLQEAEEAKDFKVYKVTTYYDTLAYLVVKKDCNSEKVDIAVQVLTRFLENV